MLKRSYLAVVIVALLFGTSAISVAKSRRHPPRQNPQSAQQQPGQEQRGSEQAPLIVKIQEPEQTQREPNPNQNKGPNHGSDGWLSRWGLSDKIAALASLVAFLQFLALIGTIWIMRLTARRQLRAYVSVIKGEVINIDGDHPIEATLAIKNSGQTPARDVLIWGGMAIRDYPLKDPINPPAKGIPRPQSLAPRGKFYKTEKSFRTPQGEITMEHRRMLRNGQISLYVYGEITYRDVFGKKWRTDYRFFCGGGHPNSFTQRDGMTVGRLVPHEEGNKET